MLLVSHDAVITDPRIVHSLPGMISNRYNTAVPSVSLSVSFSSLPCHFCRDPLLDLVSIPKSQSQKHMSDELVLVLVHIYIHAYLHAFS